MKRDETAQRYPQVDIIIPHFNGRDILRGCLSSLSQMLYPNARIVVVDNGSTDDSVRLARAEFPAVHFLTAEKNLGYAGGCNFGFKQTSGKYVVFLNNDTEQEPAWLSELVRVAEANAELAAVQPKILSIQAYRAGKRQFDYAGAAGGMLDVLGYPYCRGRVFNRTEADLGQYDESVKIFWATGAAMFARRTALETVGLFDDDFFAHMEEIDLCWRLWSAGFELKVAPSAVIYHYGGATLSESNPQKTYLNHRNNLMMILKNAETTRLLWLLALRLLLEIAAIGFYLKSGRGDSARAALDALLWNLKQLSRNLQKRGAITRLRRVSDSKIFERCKSGVAVVIGAIFRA